MSVKYRLRDLKNVDFTDEKLFTWLNTDKANTRRIVNRFITKGYWFLHQETEGRHTMIISASIDLDRDIRYHLPNIDFEVE